VTKVSHQMHYGHNRILQRYSQSFNVQTYNEHRQKSGNVDGKSCTLWAAVGITVLCARFHHSRLI